MRELEYKKSFFKDAQVLAKNGFDLTILNPLLDKLRSGEALEPKYKDHQLQGKLKDYREFHLKGDILVLYKITDTTLILYAIDNHNNLFKRFSK